MKTEVTEGEKRREKHMKQKKKITLRERVEIV